MSGRVTAVLVAAGRGERLGSSIPKQFLDLGGLPLLEWSVRRFHGHRSVDRVVVVVPPEMAERPPEWLAAAAGDRGVAVVAGGRTRAESVARGAARAPEGADVLLVHDGVRPFAGPDLIDRVVEPAVSVATIPVLPIHDTIKRVDTDGRVVETVDRTRLRRAQTPQGFPAALLRALHAGRERAAAITDDALLCERAGATVTTVEGDPLNLKITGEDDLAYARWLVDGGVIGRPTWR